MMAVIFAFSQMPGDESGATSGRILNEVVKIVKAIRGSGFSGIDTDWLHWFIRKCGHFGEYALFGWCTMFALTDLVKNKWAACIFSEAIVFIYAVTDELHQYLVPGRYMSAGDVGIDSLGALLGIWVFVLFHRNRRKNKKTKHAPHSA